MASDVESRGPSLFSHFLERLADEHHREVAFLRSQSRGLSCRQCGASDEVQSSVEEEAPKRKSALRKKTSTSEAPQASHRASLPFTWNGEVQRCSRRCSSTPPKLETMCETPSDKLDESFSGVEQQEDKALKKNCRVSIDSEHYLGGREEDEEEGEEKIDELGRLPGLAIPQAATSPKKTRVSFNMASTAFTMDGQAVQEPMRLLRSHSSDGDRARREEEKILKRKTMSKDFQEHADQYVKVHVLSNMTLCGGSDDTIMETYFIEWMKYAKHMRARIEFNLRPVWEEQEECPGAEMVMKMKSTREHLRGRMASNLSEASQLAIYQGMQARKQQQSQCCSRHIISPNSSYRVGWDLMGASLLFYDMIMVPMVVFNPPRNIVSSVMDWLTLIFWTFDMLASCMTGYMHKGETEMRSHKIIIHYLKGWFAVDVIICFPDWLFKIMELFEPGQDDSGNKGGKMLRAFRVLRTARLLRLAKLRRLINLLKDRIDSEATFIVINVMKLMFMLIVVNHFVASVWYAIGSISEPNWIDANQMNDKSLLYRYTTSLHWSLTQFTPGSMEVQPRCSTERLFSITALVFGLVLFSSIVGSITASMTQLRGMSEEKSKQFWLLRRYLRQRGIDQQLSYRVLRYIEYALGEQKDTVSERRLWVLENLSPQLRDELHFQVSFSCMNNHPLFMRTSVISDDIMRRLSRTALSSQSLAPGDLLFSAGSAASHMHMVVTGALVYVKAEDSLLEDEAQEVRETDWACEVVLWTSWTCIGTCRAIQECRLVQIEALPYGECVRKDATVFSLASRYARHYIKWLNLCPRGTLTDTVNKDATKNQLQSFLDETDDEEMDESEDNDHRPNPTFIKAINLRKASARIVSKVGRETVCTLRNQFGEKKGQSQHALDNLLQVQPTASPRMSFSSTTSPNSGGPAGSSTPCSPKSDATGVLPGRIYS